MELFWIGIVGLLALVGITLFFITPLNWLNTPDGMLHVHRTRALTEAMQAGVWYPRWFPNFSFGYGYPVLNFYAPLFYYPAALLHYFGLPLIESIDISLAIWFGLSGVACYTMLRNWCSWWAATIGAILYLAYPYHLYDLAVRGALPEFAAFLWLPLIIGFTYQLLRHPTQIGSKDIWQNRAFYLCSISWLGLILTHNLTAFILLILYIGLSPLILFSFILFPSNGQPSVAASIARRLVALFLPVGMAGLLGAWYIVPVLLESRWVGIGAASGQGYVNHLANWERLFDVSFFYTYADAADPTVSIPIITLGIICGAILLSIATLFAGIRQAFDGGRQIFQAQLLSISAAILIIWLTTNSSLWVWQIGEPLLGKLMFPWRWQTMLSLVVAALFALVLQSGMNLLSISFQLPIHKGVGLCLLSGILLLMTAPLLVNLPIVSKDERATYRENVPTSVEDMWAFEAQVGQVGTSWFAEFLPIWVTEQRWAIGREPSEPVARDGGADLAGFQITLLSKSYLGQRFQVVAPQERALQFPTFYYPSWQVDAGGGKVQTQPHGKLGLLSATLPAGEYELEMRWVRSTAVRSGNLLSAIAWAFCLFFLMRAVIEPSRRSRKNMALLSGWLIGGFIFLLASFAPPTVQAASSVQADFGEFRLIGVTSNPAETPVRVGENVDITLHWLVADQPQADYKSFIHITNLEGVPVLQHDEPVAGIYHPPARWRSGQIWRQPKRFVIPSELPQGEYLIRVGVYVASSPLDSIRPAGFERPYIQAGSLTVID